MQAEENLSVLMQKYKDEVDFSHIKSLFFHSSQGMSINIDYANFILKTCTNMELLSIKMFYVTKENY